MWDEAAKIKSGHVKRHVKRGRRVHLLIYTRGIPQPTDSLGMPEHVVKGEMLLSSHTYPSVDVALLNTCRSRGA